MNPPFGVSGILGLVSGLPILFGFVPFSQFRLIIIINTQKGSIPIQRTQTYTNTQTSPQTYTRIRIRKEKSRNGICALSYVPPQCHHTNGIMEGKEKRERRKKKKGRMGGINKWRKESTKAVRVEE